MFRVKSSQCVRAWPRMHVASWAICLALVAYVCSSSLAVVTSSDCVATDGELHNEATSSSSPATKMHSVELNEDVMVVEESCELAIDFSSNLSGDVAAAISSAGVSIGAPPRRKSVHPECQANRGPRDDPAFLDLVRPCGNYSSVCTDLPVIYANKDYPGGGIGALRPDQDYIVQFDIGLHPVVAKDVLKGRLGEIESCVHCPVFEERCLETIVTGGAMWGNLGMHENSPSAYDCMGGCGKGCSNKFSIVPGSDIGALDCLKHDVCSAWKSVQTGRRAKGFCHDPDCGDEAAMAIYNCWRGWRLFGSVGGNRNGPFSEPAICEPGNPNVRGCWNHAGWFTKGRCKVFQGTDRGQGIPDPHPLTSPIQRL